MAEKTKLQVGKPVERDDGRFYVPLNRTKIRLNDNRSMTVLRVASDAFDTVEEAVDFANKVADYYNNG